MGLAEREKKMLDRSWATQFADHIFPLIDEEIFKLTGGSMMLPRTVILNERGEVIYNAKGVLTKDRLEYLLVEK